MKRIATILAGLVVALGLVGLSAGPAQADGKVCPSVDCPAEWVIRTAGTYDQAQVDQNAYAYDTLLGVADYRQTLLTEFRNGYYAEVAAHQATRLELASANATIASLRTRLAHKQATIDRLRAELHAQS